MADLQRQTSELAERIEILEAFKKDVEAKLSILEPENPDYLTDPLGIKKNQDSIDDLYAQLKRFQHETRGFVAEYQQQAEEHSNLIAVLMRLIDDPQAAKIFCPISTSLTPTFDDMLRYQIYHPTYLAIREAWNEQPDYSFLEECGEDTSKH